MGFFGQDKPNVSENEFHKVCSELYSKGFNSTEVNKVKQVLRGDLAESGPNQKGIDSKEIDNAVSFMKKNRTFSESKIQAIEEHLRNRL